MSYTILRRTLVVALIAFLAAAAIPSAHGSSLFGFENSPALMSEDRLIQGGYLRQYASANLQDVPETPQDDAGDLNMLRTVLLHEASLNFTDNFSLESQLRNSQEVHTTYLQNLRNVAGQPAGNGFLRNGAADIESLESNGGVGQDIEIRELFFDASITNQTNVTFGKQFLSWGKGSFRRALDLVNGFDNTWAPYVTEEDERRKSNIMLTVSRNFTRDLGGGNLELFWMPALDDFEDLGNDSPTDGLRNTALSFRGIDGSRPLTGTPGGPFAGQTLLPISPVNEENHPEGNVDDHSFGIRYQNTAFLDQIEYSLAFLRTHQKSLVSHATLNPLTSTQPAASCNNNDGSLNTAALAQVTGNSPYAPGATGGALPEDAPCLRSGDREERFLPQVNVWGATANYYSQMLDVVLRGEAAYIQDRWYNKVPDPGEMNQRCIDRINNLGAGPVSSCKDLTSLATQLALANPASAATDAPAIINQVNSDGAIITDVHESDELRLMLGIDRTFYSAKYLLGADRPGLITLEFFDFIIEDHEKGIVSRGPGTFNQGLNPGDGSAGSGSYNQDPGLSQHRFEAVTNISWSYQNGVIAPGFTGLWDLSHGGNYTIVPSLAVSPSTNLRFNLSGVFIFGDNKNRGDKNTSFGFQERGDRITLESTYLF